MDGLAYNFITAAIAMATLSFGQHCSRNVSTWYGRSRASPKSPSVQKETRVQAKRDSIYPARQQTYHLISIGFGVLFYVGSLLVYFLGPRSWRHPVTFALLLGPPGTMIRFTLAKLNTRPYFEGKFPIGTFLANMLATAILAAVYVGQRAPGRPGRTSQVTGTTCNALYALEEGFCGCLSTVSTFAVELRSIKSVRWKWIYASGSVLMGHLIVLALVGGVSWSSAGLGPTCK
jgi:CrcB protein